jgi:hypothetical protein
VAGAAGTLERIAREIASALAPLEQRLSAEGARPFLGELGLRLPPALEQNAQITGALTTAAASAAGLGPLVTALTNAIAADDVEQILSASANLVAKITALLGALAKIETALTSAAAGGGLNAAQLAQIQSFAAELAPRLLGYLLIEYLRSKRPDVLAVLTLAGIVDDEDATEGPAATLAPSYRRRMLHLDRLVDLLTHPAQYLQGTFGFGGAGFDGLALFARVKRVLDDSDLPVTIFTPAGQPAILEAYSFRLSVDPATVPPSLTFRLRFPMIQDFASTYSLGGPWHVDQSIKARFDAGLDGELSPSLAIRLQPPAPGTASADVAFGVSAEQPGGSLVLFSEAGGTRLEVRRVGLRFGFTATWDAGAGVAKAEPAVTGEIAGGKLTIDLSDGDGFISAIVGGGKLSGSLDLQLHWTPAGGLQVAGSSAIQIAVPTHVSIGPVDVDTLYLQLGLAPDGSLPAELSAGFRANLGPLRATVDRIGLAFTTTFPQHGGNLGPADLALAFKPPSGVGLSVEAGLVSGGGYLYIDAARGEYAGALQLVVGDFLVLTAIGLISTRLPDGSSGFSLLIVITADFGAGIQLGFGFTLNAVGGLLGLNRSMLLQPLMDGVRSGAVDRLMFPRDVIANASRIISDLRTIFPPRQDVFLIGPMAKLGWGEPTLATLSLGVIVEAPPGDIAILGVLRLALPASDVAILVLQVNFAGALEFSKRRLYFFASLFDSHVLFITIEGEMGVLFAYGHDSNFVVSVGGFHPQFKPPPLPFPSPKRIQVNILNESYARIRCTGYFAVTTNTVQFGTHADMFFGFSALSVEGHVGFDALIQFSPFHFSVSIAASFAVKVFGFGLFAIDVRLTLDGPTPWHARGKATIKILFFSIGVGIDFTWGDKRDTMLPPVAVMPMVAGELGKQSNWRAIPHAGSNLLVALRKLDADEAALVLHPVGTLRISQRAVPLDLLLEKVGNAKPSDANRFELSVASPDLVEVDDLEESFAPAEFKSLPDADRLSQPAYVPMEGGIELAVAGGAYRSGTAITRIVRYDLSVVDTKRRRAATPFYVFAGFLFLHLLAGSHVARSTLSARHRSRTHPYKGAVAVSHERFAVARRSDNKAYAPDAASFRSRVAATDHLRRAVKSDPKLAGTLHVLPLFEVAP